MNKCDMGKKHEVDERRLMESWPSIDESEDGAVGRRILTRRMRISQRQQEIKGIILPEIKSNVCSDPPRKSRLQVVKSDIRLDKVTSDTRILVGNVRAASMAYDAERRSSTHEAKARRVEVLERESKVGTDHFKDITNRWMDTIKLKVPSELHQHLVKQKSACDAVIQEKDTLIQSLKLEIERRRMDYDERLDRQDDEMDMTVCRAREQVQLINECYADELTKIEVASVGEWQHLVENQHEEWEDVVNEMKCHQVDRLEKTRLTCDKWERELDDLSANKAREYRQIQNELQSDVERLEQSLQILKSALQLNEEKLDYGCQVLRKREEEHLKVKAIQKRKVAKLNDVVAALKSSLSTIENDNRENLCHIDRDCKRIQKQISNHDKKFRHLYVTENAKLEELWRLNDETVRNLVQDLLVVDKEICENVLNVPWQPRTLSLTTSPAVYKRSSMTTLTTRHVVRCATLFRIGILATRGRLLKSKQLLAGVPDANRQQLPSPEVRREILRILASKAKYLIDNPLRDMIETFPQNEQILMQLDTIFSALNVKSDSEVEMLVNYVFENCCKINEEVDCDKVLKAVNDFLQKRQKQCSLRKALKNVERMNKGNSRKSDLDWKCSDYWTQFTSILPQSTEMVWHALSIGLQKLRQVKMEHSKLLDDSHQLQIQNDELKFLLSDYEDVGDCNRFQPP